MPELPEVETIARGLAPLVEGKRIADARVFYPPVVGGNSARFRERVEGRMIAGVRRRGKLLILDLDDETHLAIHLRMTGRVTVEPHGTEPDRHTHVVLGLDDGVELVFNDQRKFGRFLALSGHELASWPFFARLGPEPLEIGAEQFVGLLAGRTGRIKALLLDQVILAGVGNIYADESLFRAGIHPAASAASIGREGLLKLHLHLREVLEDGLREGGSSFRDYVDALGQRGGFQERFAVYSRKGLACVSCGCVLESTKVAGRTSTFCRVCQPEHRKKQAVKRKK
jgi:formamidopyrimidine-DNA glycosylase